MAEQATTPQITTLPALQATFSDEEKKAFASVVQGNSEDISHFLFAYEKRHGTTVSNTVWNQIDDTYPYIRLQDPVSPEEAKNNSLTQAALGIGELGAAGALLAADRPTITDRIVGGVNMQNDQDLFNAFEKAVATGDVAGARNIVGSLSADELLFRQKEILKQRIKEAGSTDAAIDTLIDDKYKATLAQRQQRRENERLVAKKKGKKYRPADVLDTDQIDKLTYDMLRAKTPQERKQLFLEHVSRQQQMNTRALEQMIEKKSRFPLFNQLVLSQNVKKSLLERGKKELQAREKLAKAIKDRKKLVNRIKRALPNNSQPQRGLFFYRRPSSTKHVVVTQTVETTESQENNQQQAPSIPSFNIPRPGRRRDGRSLFNKFRGLFGSSNAAGLAGGAAEAAEAAGASSGLFAGGGIFLLILLLILAIIVVVIIVGGGSSNSALNAIQFTCGSQTEMVGLQGNPDATEKTIYLRWHVGVTGPHDDKTTTRSFAAESSIYSTICLLFGNFIPSFIEANNGEGISITPFNTFGTLVVGNLNDRDDTSKTLGVGYQLQFDVPNAGCQVKPVGIVPLPPSPLKSRKTLLWVLVNPDLCSQYQLQFLIGQSLGQTLIVQQEYLHNTGSGSVYNRFISLPAPSGIIGQDGLLPTQDCSTKAASDLQQKSCFADMVGLYLTYPYYTPAPVSLAPSTTPPPSLTSFPATFPHYYDFAKTNLFDGKDMFRNPTVASAAGLDKLKEFISIVQSCQGAGGDQHPPDIGCIINARSRAADTDKALAQALQNVNGNYQCGQYIWSAQKALSWPSFPGNVRTAEDWYTMNPGHSQKGYTFSCNPQSPNRILGNICQLTRPAPLAPGDIIIYGSGGEDDPGHIAIVMSVQPDNFTFQVSEANYKHATLAYRNTNLKDTLRPGVYILGWWTKN